MKEVLKILFDLSFYYALSGYFLYLFTGNHPSAWGVPLLTISACAFILLTRTAEAQEGSFFASRTRHSKAVIICSIICCALPGALFAFGISFRQIMQFLPAWVYLIFTLLSGRIHTTREDFKKHFSFTGRIFMLMIPVFAFVRVEGALAGAIPYAILYLMTGVCLMRVLRDDGRLTVRRNIAVLLSLLLVSVAFAILQAPQLILSAIGFIYEHIIARLLVGMATALFWLLGISLLEGTLEPEELPNQMPGEFIAEGTTLPEMAGWLVAIPIIITICIVVLVIFRIFRRLLGNNWIENRVSVYTEKHERLQKQGRSRKRSGIFRPRDPRLAVRWYYRKYLKEGIIRGAQPSRTDTSMSILHKYNPFFPAEDAEKLRELYIVSRYNYGKKISKADVSNAAKTWREMK
ncbi:MAG: hypothetical protein FWE83_09460 [Oscillospiraceae bacterium]|nr:hypothetical protein [Oscillospiraceae bacterium]